MIYLRVKSEKELLNWAEKLDFKGIKWTGFREPDIGNQMTAIACFTHKDTFKKLPLL